MLKSYQISCVANTQCQVGESPIWIPSEHAIYWVDILGKAIYAYNIDLKKIRKYGLPEITGFIVPRKRGGFVLGMKSKLMAAKLCENGRVELEQLDEVDIGLPQNRFNDACCDLDGNLWAVTMDMKRTASTAKVYRYDRNFNRTTMAENFIIANGPIPDLARKTFYCIETVGNQDLAKGVYKFDLSNSSLTNRRLFLDWSKEEARPDGAILDAEGNLIVAEWRGSCIRKYNSYGKLMHKIELPARNITKAVFGGHDLSTLYVTTSKLRLTDEELERYPQSGGLFEIKDFGRGLPTYTFGN